LATPPCVITISSIQFLFSTLVGCNLLILLKLASRKIYICRMFLALIAVLLFAAMLVYFRIADRYNIIDRPNERSSHTRVTIRGGGIVFYLGALAWFIWSGAVYPYFFTGLTLITLISFLDDILTLSNRIRISIHLLSYPPEQV